MNKDYNIMLTEENTKLGVYIIPHGVKITDKSLFRIRIGFIDLDEDPLRGHCLDSDRMTLEVMESIVYSWKRWKENKEIETMLKWKEDKEKTSI